MRLLIIEDDPMVASIHQDFCQKLSFGLTVSHAKTIEQGMQLFQRESFDIVLLDNYLPDGQGVDVLSTFASVPVIMITAANDTTTVQKALKMGVIDYLVKPFTFERFEVAIKRAVQFRKLKDTDNVNQKMIDEWFAMSNTQTPQSSELPKGLAKVTLRKIIEIIFGQSSAFTTQSIADASDISRITIKKYLNYLVGIGALNEDADYLTLGRPVSVYTVNLDVMDKIYHQI